MEDTNLGRAYDISLPPFPISVELPLGPRGVHPAKLRWTRKKSFKLVNKKYTHHDCHSFNEGSSDKKLSK